MAVTGRKLQKNSSKLNSIFRFGSLKIKAFSSTKGVSRITQDRMCFSSWCPLISKIKTL